MCDDGQLRLSSSMGTAMSGRVEICFNETWGTICDSFWTNDDGKVACRQLGFSKRGRYAETQMYHICGAGFYPVGEAGGSSPPPPPPPPKVPASPPKDLVNDFFPLMH